MNRGVRGGGDAPDRRDPAQAEALERGQRQSADLIGQVRQVAVLAQFRLQGGVPADQFA